MVSTPQNRRFARFEFEESPILFEIPDVSPVMVEPRNISWGGYEVPEREANALGAKVTLSNALRPPEAGIQVHCDMEVLRESFHGLVAEIPWVQPGAENHSACTFGVRITVPGDQMDRFRRAMKLTLVHLRPEKAPPASKT